MNKLDTLFRKQSLSLTWRNKEMNTHSFKACVRSWEHMLGHFLWFYHISCYNNSVKVAINWTSSKRDSELTPFIKQMRIQSMAAQTIGSQFPLVPMVNVKGLNSQAITDHNRLFLGIPRSFRMVSMNNPMSKSAEQIIIHHEVYQGN